MTRKSLQNLKYLSTHQFAENHPKDSAAKLITHPKLKFSFLILLALLPFSNIDILTLYLSIFHLIYIIFNIFKFFLIAIGYEKKITDSYVEIPDDDLPIYSVLIPLLNELKPAIVENIQKISYPKEKLDIKIIIESNDEITKNALQNMSLPQYIEIIEIPDFLPKTKPKACNYAMNFIKGKYVTIYDAEDCPEPNQLKKAAYKFAELSENYACLQAKLNFYNADDTLLTKMFSIEYFSWFNFMLPALQKLKMPIPLGGTSNHFKVYILRKIGNWDPFNVTEDAEIGLRIAQNGYFVYSLDSQTLEEAPTNIKTWINQRSRWIKGYMQTYLVKMRHPIEFYRKTGILGHFTLQIFIGFSCLSFIATPLIMIYSYVSIFNSHHEPFLSLIISSFYLNGTIFILLPLAICIFANAQQQCINSFKASIAALLFPLYFLFHSISSIKALWELFFKPHYWEKTPHNQEIKTK